MTALVFLEHHGGELQKGGLGVLSKAATLGDAIGVVLGPGASDIGVDAGSVGEAGAGTSVLDLGRPARLHGLECSGACDPDPRRSLPSHVDENRVAERRPLSDELAACEREIREIPVDPGVEPGGKTGRDIGREHRGREEDRVGSCLLDEARDRVDPRTQKARFAPVWQECSIP